MRTVLLTACFVAMSTSLAAQELLKPTVWTTPEEAETALKDVILKHYPEAKLTLNERFFAAQANTMEFTIHNIMRDGSTKEIPDKHPGPKHDGFMISVALKEGVYGGPMFLPQTLREPYWETHVGQMVNQDGKSHLFISYKFGSNMKGTDFHRAILVLLRSTPRPLINNGNRSLDGHPK